ncbi:hypothetical protein KXX44_001815, partial [Aspergillus fumigatus]
VSSAALSSRDLGERVRGGAERGEHAGMTLARCSPAHPRLVSGQGATHPSRWN